jgi:DNA-binding NarL/FixJ family response regulator
MTKTSICIIDDHKIVRQGLKELIEKLGSFKVTLEFEDGVSFLNSLPLESPADIYILDYSMPDLNGIEVLKQLNQKEEEYKVLLLTQNFDENIINEAYTNGARGFLNKNCTAHDLKYAINNIITIGYNNVSEILKRVRNYEGAVQNNNKKIELSVRELEFLSLVCDENEFTYEQMSLKMGLSIKTLEGYRVAIFDRFKIKSKVGLVLFSFKNKLTEPFL